MDIHEVPTRSAEDAWIEKYRRALDAAPGEPERKAWIHPLVTRVGETLVSILRRAVERVRQLQKESLRTPTEVAHGGVLHPSTTDKRPASLVNDARPSRIAS